MRNDGRRKPRYRCRIRVAITTRRGRSEGCVLDVSEGGMRLQTDRVIDVWTGDEVEISCPELGLITGTARWRSPGQLGIRFDNSTNMQAKVQALQKFMTLKIRQGTLGS